MLIYDFFSGTGSSTQAFVNQGHTVISFEIDNKFQATENVDILSITSNYLLDIYGRPDFIWASPPCTTFSVASIYRHWAQGGDNPIPKTEAAIMGQNLVAYARKLIEELNPRYGFLIENPRGMLRKLPVVAGLPRTTVTYCQYGDTRMKPTDLWGYAKGWTPRQACKNGMSCHVAAPRGSQTGTQGISAVEDRSRVPYELGLEILKALSSSVASIESSAL
jgi:hypothetical protein